jgi:hypothetical protein
MGQCIARTKNGTSCQNIASLGKKYCHAHQNQRFWRSAGKVAIGTIILTILGFIADITGILSFLGISISKNQGSSQNINSVTIGNNVSNSPIIQSGGGDVTINQPDTPPKVVAARQVSLCMESHKMSSAYEWVLAENQNSHITFFKFCDWPPQSYSESDGYSQISVETVETLDSAPPRAVQVAPYVDRIKSSCKRLKLSYSFGVQMMYGFPPVFEVDSGTIDHLNNILGYGDKILFDRYGNSIYDGLFLGFYPARDEIDILHLDVNFLDNAECVRDK